LVGLWGEHLCPLEHPVNCFSMAGNGEDWRDDNTQTEEPPVASESMGMETQLDGLASKMKLSSMLRSARRWAQSSCHQSEHSNCFWQLDNSSSSSSRSCWSFHCLFSVVVNPICLVLSRLRLSLCAAVDARLRSASILRLYRQQSLSKSAHADFIGSELSALSFEAGSSIVLTCSWLIRQIRCGE